MIKQHILSVTEHQTLNNIIIAETLQSTCATILRRLYFDNNIINLNAADCLTIGQKNRTRATFRRKRNATFLLSSS